MRHDVVKDVGRLERWVSAAEDRDGAVVVVTNDSYLWRIASHERGGIDTDFRIHEGATLSGRRQWGPCAGATTTAKREAPIDLVGQYAARWRPFSTLPGDGNTEMRVLVLPVDVPPGSAPPPAVAVADERLDRGHRGAAGTRVTTGTIWQKLERCVSVLPEPFTRQEIVSWFRRHEPDVKEQSLSPHIQMATAGKGTGIYAGRTPLVERIGHGLYRRYRD
ncbi:DUF7669 domain-containing protein [Aquipuribacter nitratireducens]|uniref:DUF7669 domain-containing protein n=1 Tax=Aquipuribacter nitratireducens TaxID=650104 RepID=A0ABW0GHT5_9MICO